ncbi:b25.1 [Murid betaherpesvirus 8]|uniref:B25.1 n=1 Tax=Rat cytomegalovirus (isolate England) TaxID=1261657 RepID=A0A0E3SWR4_RCMVE|nr:b25.1 [Murid betaherpesvirus 8]WPH24941.1 b25.1 [Murid betaherpesvirus 8]WPH25075.1 b25.1 [Murid betaherpesvirus 8]
MRRSGVFTAVSGGIQFYLRVSGRRGRRYSIAKRRAKFLLQPRAAFGLRTLRPGKWRCVHTGSGVCGGEHFRLRIPSKQPTVVKARRVPTYVLQDRDSSILLELPCRRESTGRQLPVSGSYLNSTGTRFYRAMTKIRRMLELDEVIYATQNLERCRDFVKQMRGCRLQISWPKDYILSIQSENDLKLPVSELNRLSQCYLCCDEELAVLGCVHRADSSDKDTYLGVIVVGERSRIYMYAPDVDDAMYLLGDDVIGFLKRGLKRFYPMYGHLGLSGYGLGFVDRVKPIGAMSVAQFALTFPGLMFALPWPRDSFLKTIIPRKQKIQSGNKSYSLIYFGTISGNMLHPALREVIFAVNDRDEVFAYNPWDDNIIRLCGGISEFFSIGPRMVVKSYRFRSGFKPKFGDRVSQCPHIEPISLPGEIRGEDHAMRGLCRNLNIFLGSIACVGMKKNAEET